MTNISAAERAYESAAHLHRYAFLSFCPGGSGTGFRRHHPTVSGSTVYRAKDQNAKGKALETRPWKFTRAHAGTVRRFPIRFSIPLRKLQPDSYDCQVTVLDPEDGKAAFWRASFVLLP